MAPSTHDWLLRSRPFLVYPAVIVVLLAAAGLLAGYVWYEFVPLASHGTWRVTVLRRMNRHHALHHYKDWDRAFGVTTTLWDRVFGTLPGRSAARQALRPPVEEA